jgi:hypothetical protein
MSTARGETSAYQGHIEALIAKHAALDIQIREEQKYPAMRTELIRSMKAEKLRIKEEIEQGRKQARA